MSVCAHVTSCVCVCRAYLAFLVAVLIVESDHDLLDEHAVLIHQISHHVLGLHLRLQRPEKKKIA
jgi:hypothetical protein